MTLLLASVAGHLVQLSKIDMLIIVFYFALVLAIGFLFERPREHQRRLLHGWTRHDRLGRGAEFLVGQSWRARVNGLGRFRRINTEF